jgi:hypothetical protein
MVGAVSSSETSGKPDYTVQHPTRQSSSYSNSVGTYNNIFLKNPNIQCDVMWYMNENEE